MHLAASLENSTLASGFESLLTLLSAFSLKLWVSPGFWMPHFFFWLSSTAMPVSFGIIELWFLDSPLFALLCASMHHTYASTYLAIHCRVLRSFAFSSVSPRTRYIRLAAFHSIKWILWIRSTYLTVHDLHLRSSNPSIFFSNNTSSDVCVSGNVDVFQRNRKRFLSRHVQLTRSSTWWR